MLGGQLAALHCNVLITVLFRLVRISDCISLNPLVLQMFVPPDGTESWLDFGLGLNIPCSLFPRTDRNKHVALLTLVAAQILSSSKSLSLKLAL